MQIWQQDSANLSSQRTGTIINRSKYNILQYKGVIKMVTNRKYERLFAAIDNVASNDRQFISFETVNIGYLLVTERSRSTDFTRRLSPLIANRPIQSSLLAFHQASNRYMYHLKSRRWILSPRTV
jgi:hypothetical protein